MPEGSKLYYVKAGEYTGYATKGEYRDGSLQYAWKSLYGGKVSYEFSRTNLEPFWVYSYTSRWEHFDGGVDVGLPPLI